MYSDKLEKYFLNLRFWEKLVEATKSTIWRPQIKYTNTAIYLQIIIFILLIKTTGLVGSLLFCVENVYFITYIDTLPISNYFT